MQQQVAQEWFYDSHNTDEMDQNLFSKFIFRIAHQWATSISINEYVELLEKIYQRIVNRKIVRSSGTVDVALPTIQITIDQDKQPQSEEFEDAEWESCAEDDSEEEAFNYETRDDGKKYKQRKPDDNKEEIKDVFLTARDPFYFKEVVQYYVADADGKTNCAAPKNDDIEYEVLTDHSNIFPLGYPTEQYLAWVKNDVHKAM